MLRRPRVLVHMILSMTDQGSGQGSLLETAEIDRLRLKGERHDLRQQGNALCLAARHSMGWHERTRRFPEDL